MFSTCSVIFQVNALILTYKTPAAYFQRVFHEIDILADNLVNATSSLSQSLRRICLRNCEQQEAKKNQYTIICKKMLCLVAFYDLSINYFVWKKIFWHKWLNLYIFCIHIEVKVTNWQS